MAEGKEQVFDIPKTCKAGVVVNEGPDFHVEVRDVPVPEISEFSIPFYLEIIRGSLADAVQRGQ